MKVIVNEFHNLEYFEVSPIFQKLIDEVICRLAGESVYEKQIADAYKSCEIVSVEFTGNGFYVAFSSEEPANPTFLSLSPFGQTSGWIEDCMVGYILFFREGKLSTLECCCYTDTAAHPFPKMEDIRSYSFCDPV